MWEDLTCPICGAQMITIDARRRKVPLFHCPVAKYTERGRGPLHRVIWQLTAAQIRDPQIRARLAKNRSNG